MSVEDDRAFLNSISAHSGRPGDTSNLHPELVQRLAAAIRQARSEGMPLTLFSGFREPGQVGAGSQSGRYDLKGLSSHSYGLATDIGGLDGPNGRITQRWAQIAGQHGLSNPYGVGNEREFNHWQLNPQPLERTPQLLASLKAAKGGGDYSKVWAAYQPTVAGAMAQAATGTPRGEDNRNVVFTALVGAGLNPQQALGVLWSLGGESRPNLDTGAYNPKDPGGAFGIAQWTGGSGRRQQLEAYARSQGRPVTDIYAQTGYLINELHGDYKGVLEQLKQAPDAAAASRIWTTKFEIPRNAAAVAEQRIAQGARVGSVDAQGNFVPGSAAAAGSGSTPPASGGATPEGSGTPASNTPMPPIETPEMTMGQALSKIGMSMGSGGGSQLQQTGGDQPAIRMPALEAQGAPTPSPQPLEYQQGHSALAQQLGMLGAQPMPGEGVTGAPDSITAGAPSMTAMLGMVGTPAEYNYLDPRRTTSPTLKAPLTRLG